MINAKTSAIILGKILSDIIDRIIICISISGNIVIRNETEFEGTEAHVLKKIKEVLEKLLEFFPEIINGSTMNDIKKISQRDFSKIITIDEPLMSRMSKIYIQTPFWGIIQVKELFQWKMAVESTWGGVLEKIQVLIDSEDISMPIKTKEIWEKFQVELDQTMIRDNTKNGGIRTLKNHMGAYGIPLETPRKFLYIMTTEKTHDVVIYRNQITQFRKNMIRDGLFQTKKTYNCLEPQFIPFIEKRILKILQQNGKLRE